jgi:hypothetical protein
MSTAGQTRDQATLPGAEGGVESDWISDMGFVREERNWASQPVAGSHREVEREL